MKQDWQEQLEEQKRIAESNIEEENKKKVNKKYACLNFILLAAIFGCARKHDNMCSPLCSYFIVWQVDEYQKWKISNLISNGKPLSI